MYSFLYALDTNEVGGQGTKKFSALYYYLFRDRINLIEDKIRWEKMELCELHRKSAITSWRWEATAAVLERGWYR